MAPLPLKLRGAVPSVMYGRQAPSGEARGAGPRCISGRVDDGVHAPKAEDAPFEEYVSDPAKPFRFRRASEPAGRLRAAVDLGAMVVDDQREASGRPDVAVFTSAPLPKAVKISGQPIANLIASTTGTDADWVVKLIDVYPNEVAGQPDGRLSADGVADIFRGR